MASFKCADLGMKCGFEVKDADKDELNENRRFTCRDYT